MTTPLDMVWARIPDVGCKGLCVESCGPIAASPLELRLLANRGIHIEPDVDKTLARIVLQGADTCPALIDGRCTVYEIRPTICRLFGAVEQMPCPFGCEPDGGLLDSGEGFDILAAANQVGQLSNRAQRRKAKR